MRIWITGGAGFLGRRLSQQLFADGHEVFSISRRQHDLALRSHSVDLASRSAVSQLTAIAEEDGSPDAVIHTASRQPGLKGSQTDYVKSNLTSTVNLLRALEKTPPKTIIYTSTITVYGRPTRNPVDETSPAGGSLPYSATKRWSEQIVEEAKTSAARIVLRLPSLYGKGQDDSLIDGLARTALTDQPIELFSRGETIRDALHVSDVITAIQQCLSQSPKSSFVCLNLGCGQPITTFEWAEAMVDALQSKSSIQRVDKASPQSDLYANIELAKQTIGFCPTELRQSMKIYADELRT
jgi:nucleoside-diphosphate-sugar epimerase